MHVCILRMCIISYEIINVYVKSNDFDIKFAYSKTKPNLKSMHYSLGNNTHSDNLDICYDNKAPTRYRVSARGFI